MAGKKDNGRSKQKQREISKWGKFQTGSGTTELERADEKNKTPGHRTGTSGDATLRKQTPDSKTSNKKMLKDGPSGSKSTKQNASLKVNFKKQEDAGREKSQYGIRENKMTDGKTGSKKYRTGNQNRGTKSKEKYCEKNISEIKNDHKNIHELKIKGIQGKEIWGKEVQGKGIQEKRIHGKNIHEKNMHKNPKDKENWKGKTCPVMHKCGGCRYLSLSYEQQLEKKEQIIREYYDSFLKFEPIIGMEKPYYYRSKVHSVFGEDRKHNIISGNYEEKTHRIVSSEGCVLENRQANAIIISIKRLMKSFKIRPYNEDTGYGLLRHVLIRTGYRSGQIMVVLVLASPILPSKNNFVKALLELHPEITTIVINVNNRGTSMVLGDKENVIYGQGYIEDVLCGKTFRISPKSFYQVNPAQTEKLYSKAMEFAGLTGSETVLDAYCGTGTIGMIAADRAEKVIGVELNRDAVKDARINAKQNEIHNIEFYQKDAGQFMVQLAEQNIKVDVVFMDPPRSGSDKVFLEALAKLQPEKIVYISCNPETLGRDMEVLKKKGYKGARGVGVDMFPWTGHVETVVILSRAKK